MLLSRYVEVFIRRRDDLLKDTLPPDLEESTYQFMKSLQDGQMRWRHEEADSILRELRKAEEIIRCYLASS